MKRTALVLIALLSISCSRYETKTADGVTLRIDKTTGATDRLVNGRWIPIKEAVAPGPPVSLTEDRRGQPCKIAPRPGQGWADEIEEQVKTGCTPTRSDQQAADRQ